MIAAVSWGSVAVGVIVFLILATALGVVMHVGQGRPHS